MLVKCFCFSLCPLSTGAFTDDDIFPVRDPELAGISLVQVEDIEVLPVCRGAAGIFNFGSPPPPAWSGSLGLDVHQRLQEGVVIEGVISGRAGATTEGGVKHSGLVDESKPLQLLNIHRHFLPGKERRLRDCDSAILEQSTQ